MSDLEYTFRAGYRAGWLTSGEGKNAESSRLAFSEADWKREQDANWLEFLEFLDRPGSKVKLNVPPMKRLIERLLAEAPPLGAVGTPAPGQTPAIECIVLLSGAAQAMRGSLSTTPEGTLRMMSVGNEGNRPVLVEQFFTYEAVLSIALIRAVDGDSRRILVPKG